MIKKLPLPHWFSSLLIGIGLSLLAALLLSFSIKTNNPANPWILTHSTEVGGPFESSNTTSRMAIVESIVKYRRFDFNLGQARFAVPDAVETNGKFYSSFTPGVSFIAVPFYYLGTLWLEQPDLSVFLSTIMFAVLNGWLLFALARRLGASVAGGLLASTIFLFSTNAFAYTGTLTQHHGSTALLLMSLLLVLQPTTWWRNILFGVLCGISFLFDFPNLFMLFPVGVYLISQHASLKSRATKYVFSFKLSWVLIAVGLLPLLGIFGWYNQVLSGSPVGFAQFQLRTNYFDTEAKKAEDRAASLQHDEYDSNLPFNTRLQLRGTYILGFSNERSWLWYSPILLVGIIGLIILYRQQPAVAVLIASVVSINFVMYSMFGDPWGGWSFGPRYLIPGAAIMACTTGIAITRFRRNVLFVLLFISLIVYSTVVSIAGGITTAAIPPKIESQALINYVPYTYRYNFMLLESNGSKSLIYQTWLKQSLTSYQLYYILLATILGWYALLLIINALSKSKEI